jgi:hypothetical protein
VGRRGRPAPGPRARREARRRSRARSLGADRGPGFPGVSTTGSRADRPCATARSAAGAPGVQRLRAYAGARCPVTPPCRPQPRRPTTPVPAVAATTSPGRRRLRTSRRKLLSAAPRHRSLEGRSSAGGRRDRDDQHQQRRRPGGPHARTPARPRTPRPGAPGGVAAPEALPSCTLGAVSRSSGRTCGHQPPGRRGDPRQASPATWRDAQRPSGRLRWRLPRGIARGCRPAAAKAAGASSAIDGPRARRAGDVASDTSGDRLRRPANRSPR